MLRPKHRGVRHERGGASPWAPIDSVERPRLFGSGSYFVTICAYERRCIFGSLDEGKVDLAPLGWIAHQNWIAISSHLAWVNLHGFVVMPNHVHGIGCQDAAQRAAPLQGILARSACQHPVRPGSLSAIVRSFKAAVTKQSRKELSWTGEIWQRNYFERVIRNGQEFSDASRYIAENPMRWEWDRENPKRSEVLATGVNGEQHAAPLRPRLQR
jgi:putative transposase